MGQSRRFLVARGVLLAVLLLLVAGSPVALAQGTPVAGTPVSTPAAAVECDDASGGALETEVVPPGVVRELLLTTAIDSTGFAGEDLETGDEVPALSAVTSIVCIAPNSAIEVQVEGAPSTANVSQYYTTTLIVLEGELELMLAEGCANPGAGATCTVTEGVATFRAADDRTNAEPISDTEFTPVPAGGIVVLSDVTVMIETGDAGARLLTTGVAADPTGGGACPSGCGRWRFP